MPGTPVPPGDAARLIVAPCRVALLADSVGHDLMLNGLGASARRRRLPDHVVARAARAHRSSTASGALTAAGGWPADVIVVLQGYSKATSHRAEFPGLVDQVLRTANGRKVVWTLYGAHVRLLGRLHRAPSPASTSTCSPPPSGRRTCG